MAMTPRENAMAIFYGRQPDYYGDIMEAITLVPDPVMFGDLPPRDGKEYRDSCVHLASECPGTSSPGDQGECGNSRY